LPHPLTLADLVEKIAEDANKQDKVDPSSMAEFVKETIQIVIENADGSTDPKKLFESYQKLLRQGIEIKYTRNTFLGRLIHGDEVTIVKRISKPTKRRKSSQ